MQYSITEFESIYVQCFPSSMRLAMSLLLDEDEARDVVQEVFIKLWESEFKISNPTAFIIKSVRNRCLNHINTLDTREKIHRRLSVEPQSDDSCYEERDESVRSAIGKLLTPREKDVVGKIYSDGLSYKDTAECLGISVASVNKNIVAALKKLRNHFKTCKS